MSTSWDSKKLIFLLLLVFAISVILIFNINSRLSQSDEVAHILKNRTEAIRVKPPRVQKPTSPACKSAPPNAITSINEGRLGNQLFSYASLYAIAKQNNRTAFMSPLMSTHLTQYFKPSLPTIPSAKFKCIAWQRRQLTRNRDQSANLIKNISTNYVMFTGYPETFRYFENYIPEIRKELTFLPSILENSIARINQAKTELGNGTVVGIHVRRQDYVAYSKTVNVELPTMDFYNGAMEYFVKKYTKVIFIVASDDPGWVKSNFNSTRYKISYLNGKPNKGGLDLAVLANCDHVIFGIGTFGFWGGFLTAGETVYCSDCVLPSSRWMKVLLDYGNFVLGTWIGFDRKGERSYELVKYDDTMATTTQMSNKNETLVQESSILTKLSSLWRNKLTKSS